MKEQLHLLHTKKKCYCSFFMVESPKGKYNGQKLIKLVATKIPASTNNTIATVPLSTCVK